MTDLKVFKSSFNGNVTIPSSKSVAHRMIIASVLSGACSTVIGNLNSKDIKATLGCMEALGAKVNYTKDGAIIDATKLMGEANTFDVNESGSTLRFLLPVIPIYRSNFSIKGAGRIGERPIKSLKTAMEACGVKVSGDYIPVTVEGSYDKCDFTVNATESSQYVTGLLYTIAKLGGGKLKIEGTLTSKGYIDITTGVLKAYGVAVDYSESEKTFTISAPNGFVAPKVVNVNGDWSSACFWAVAGVLSGDIAIKGLNYPDSQPDSIIVDVLKKAGGNVSFKEGVLYAKKSTLKAIEFDADGSPDIVPILAVALSQANGDSLITGTARLKIKESDRVKAVADMLSVVGIKTEIGENHMKIYGGATLHGGVIDSVNDHRIAMSGMILGSLIDEVTTILGTECTAKSYPDFVKDYLNLGGKIV